MRFLYLSRHNVIYLDSTLDPNLSGINFKPDYVSQQTQATLNVKPASKTPAQHHTGIG